MKATLLRPLESMGQSLTIGSEQKTFVMYRMPRPEHRILGRSIARKMFPPQYFGELGWTATGRNPTSTAAITSAATTSATIILDIAVSY